MTGAEYLNVPVLISLWEQLEAALRAELAQSKESLQDFLKRHHPAWNLLGRVHFNLAENRSDEAAPFAFIATYTTRLSAHARAQHLPLAQALREYRGARLDVQPELLFTLRKVDAKELISRAGEVLPQAGKKAGAARILDSSKLSEVFGIELADPVPMQRSRAKNVVTKAKQPAKGKSAKRGTTKARRAVKGSRLKLD